MHTSDKKSAQLEDGTMLIMCLNGPAAGLERTAAHVEGIGPLVWGGDFDGEYHREGARKMDDGSLLWHYVHRAA